MTNQKEALDRARQVIEKIPFNTLLGIQLSRFHPDGVTLRCHIREELLNGHGSVHGGVTASLADVAVAVAIHRHCAGTRPITTVELKVNYLAPVRAGTLFARARLLRVGSTLCVGRVDLTDAEANVIGTAIVTYIFLDGRGTKRAKSGRSKPTAARA
jgi:uncharacterized protein (TIGR00369 family)